MLHVVIDTSIFRNDPSRKQVAFKAIERLAKHKRLTLHIPYYVAQEFISQQVDEFNGYLQQITDGINGFERKRLSEEATYQTNKLSEEFKLYADYIRHLATSEFHEWMSEVDAQLHAISDSHGRRVAEDYFAGVPPFKSKKNRKDIPDAFIWHTILDLCQEYDEIHFISGDNAFFEACAAVNNVRYYKSIKDFLSSDACRAMMPEVNAREYIKSFGYNHLNNTNVLLQNIFNHQIGSFILHSKVKSSGIPSVDGEATIRSLSEANNIIILAEEIQYYGEGLFIIPFLTFIGTTLTYLIQRGDYFSLSRHRTRHALVHNTEGSIFEVEENFTIQVNGTFVVALGKESVEEHDLSEDQIAILFNAQNTNLDIINSVQVMMTDEDANFRPSSRLRIGKTYSLLELQTLFDINIPQPDVRSFAVHKRAAIWLFVTESRAASRREYSGVLRSNILQWCMPSSDYLKLSIEEHQSKDIEILIFYRKGGRGFARRDFTYEGVFNYLTHSGKTILRFFLQRSTDIINE